MNMAMRIAGAGNQIGLTEAETLSLSTALSSVGIKAEQGGTAISRVMTDMAAATTIGTDRLAGLEKATGKTRRELELMSSNDGSGFKALADSIGMTTTEINKTVKAGKQLEEFSKIAGVTTDQFTKKFEEDAIGAIGMFIKGLGNAEEQGETSIGMLDDLGVASVRLRDTLMRLGGAEKLFSDSVTLGNKAWEENVALSNEAAQRYETSESKLKMLKNTVVDAAIEMGGNLAPSLISVVETGTKAVETFSKLPESVQTGTVKFAALFTVLGGGVSIISRLSRGFGDTKKLFSTLDGLFMGTKKLTDDATGSISTFGKIIGGLSSPTGMIIAATTGAVALGAKAIYDHVQDAKKAKQELEDMAKNAPQIIESYEEELDYLQDTKKEFEELNGLVGKNGDLSKLTVDEQARYLDLVLKLKEVSPDMGVYYDDQGRMIANANTELEKLIETKKKEMNLDKEKIAEGYDNRIKDHEKENNKRDRNIKEIERNRSASQRIANATNSSEKTVEFHNKKIAEYNKQIEELTKSQGSINKTMEVAGAQLDVMNSEYDGLISNVGDYKGMLEQILSDDTSNAGLETMEKAKDVMSDIFALAKQEKDGGMKVLPTDIDKEIEKLISLGVSYEDASRSIYGTMIVARDGEEAFKQLNDTMGKQTSLKDIFEEMKKADNITAEYIASLITLENQIDQFSTKSKEQLNGLGVSNVLTKGQTEEQLNIAKANSKEMLKTIRDEADMQIQIVEYRRDHLGSISDEEAKKEIENIKKVTEDRKNSTQRELSRQTDALLEHGSRARKVFRDMAEELEGGKVSTEDFQSMWGNLDLDTQKLLLDISDIDAGKKGWESLMQEWILNDPQAKELIVYQNGLEFALDNIDELGIEWGSLSSEEKMLTITAIGEGLEEHENFIEYWKGLEDDDEKKFFILSKHEGIEDVEAFEEYWNGLPSDEEKDLVLNVLTSGVEDTKQFQEDWNKLDPEVKKFVAEAVGIEDVEKADEKTMNEWAKDPKVKEFVAKSGGLDKVRAERRETDGVWEVTIGKKTYEATPKGLKEVRTEASKTETLWDKIKPKKKTFTAVFEKFFRGGKPEENWTGNDNFKGGLSFLGEKGRELLVFPDGSYDMTGDTTELRNLPKGTRIFNNRDTEDILSGRKTPGFEGVGGKASGMDKELEGIEIPGFAKGNTTAKGKPGNTKAKAYKTAKDKADAKVAANKKVTESEKAKADMYEHANLMLFKQNNLINENKLMQERAKDGTYDKIRLLKEEIELEKQNQKLLNNKLNLHIKERNQQEAILKKQGFKFKGKGNDKQITNLGNINGKSKEVEEAFNKFNELQFKLIPGLQADIIKITNTIMAATSEGFLQQTRINNHMNENKHLLEMNAIYQERANNDLEEKIRLMKEEIKLHERTAYLTRGQGNQYRTERDILESNLRREGAKFSGSGDNKIVTNPNFIKGKVKEVEDQLNRYNEIQFDLIPNIIIDEAKINDAINRIKTSLLQAEFDISDKIIDDYDYTIEREQHNRKGNQRKDPYWQKQGLERELKANEDKYSHQYNKGWEYLNEADKYDEGSEQWKILKDKSEEYFRAARAGELEIADLKAELHQANLLHIENELDANKKAQDELIFQRELLADDDLEGRLKLSEEIARTELESYTTLKNNVKALEDQLKVTLENTDEWHILNDSLEEYNEKLKDSTLEIKNMKNELVKLAQEQAQLTFDKDLENAELDIFGGKTEKDAKKELDDRIQAQQDFIDGEEKALEIARIRKMVEEDGLVLTQEQQQILNEGGKVERTKLERMNKQLEIQKLQNKLANLKDQKTIRQLTQKDDGTFDFEYVADKKAIRETEDAITDSKKGLIDWERDYRIEQDRKAFEDKQKRLAEEEERLRESLEKQNQEIEAHYQALLKQQQAMIEMSIMLTEQMGKVNDTDSISGWEETLKEILPTLDELGMSFADMMEEMGLNMEDHFHLILPILYDMGVLHEDMVNKMGLDFEGYVDAAIPVLDELGIDHEEFLTFMGVDLEEFLEDAEVTFAEYSEAVRKKNAETKADVDRTKAALRVPTESTHTVHLDAPPPFSMPDSYSTHTIHTVHTSSGGGGGGSDSGGDSGSAASLSAGDSPKAKMAAFKDGGKTPAFSGGKVALLHEKEIVLNKAQSETFEKLVNLMPNMVNSFNDIAGKFKGVTPKIPKVPNITSTNYTEKTTEQHFHIGKLDFSGIKSVDKLEETILNLPRTIIQNG